MFNICLLILVKMNFDQLWAIKFHSNSFSNNLSREHQIFEYGIINSSQSATETK